MIVHKKTWPKYFNMIKEGKKKFELRIADFDIKEGDTLILEEWDPETKEYTGKKIEKKVEFVIRLKNLTQWWTKEEIEKHGFYVIQLRD